MAQMLECTVHLRIPLRFFFSSNPRAIWGREFRFVLQRTVQLQKLTLAAETCSIVQDAPEPRRPQRAHCRCSMSSAGSLHAYSVRPTRYLGTARARAERPPGLQKVQK